MIVVDASLAAKWVLPEEHSTLARDLAFRCASEGTAMVAPPFILAEVTNILRQRMVRDDLSLADAHNILRQFLAFPVDLRAPPGLYEMALTIAAETNLPSAYDAHYVALAQTLGCSLWTDDRRLLRTVGGRLPFVRAIAEYSLSDAL